jgi:hypothetical protein
MAEIKLIVQKRGTRRAGLALGFGVLAAVAFFGLGFAFESWWFVIGLVFSAAAVVTGVRTRRGGVLSQTGRRLATAGVAVGGVVVAWFTTFMVVAGISAIG